MKKKLIPAGLVLLAMACGEHEAKQSERPEPAASVPVNPKGKPSAGEAEETTAADEAGGNTNFNLSVSDVNLTYQADIATPSVTASGLASSGPVPETHRVISSTAAVTGTDTNHRFIRTADIAFRVKDVVQATLGIEDIVKAHGGWVESTHLRSEPRGTQTIPVSEDSLVELSRFDLMNSVRFRVPDEELDVAIREIGAWVDLFDHRNIAADDIKLRMTANALAERRAKAHSQRLGRAIDDRGRRLRETVSAEEAVLASDEKRDQSLLHNLNLADRVAYSVVSLEIHQPTLTRREMKASDHALSAYQPSLGSSIGDALADGWRLVEVLITGLIGVWPVLVLLGGSLWLLWRKRRSSMGALPPLAAPQV